MRSKKDKITLAEYLESKGFNPDDAPYIIKDEWKDFPICKAIIQYYKENPNG